MKAHAQFNAIGPFGTILYMYVEVPNPNGPIYTIELAKDLILPKGTRVTLEIEVAQPKPNTNNKGES